VAANADLTAGVPVLRRKVVSRTYDGLPEPGLREKECERQSKDQQFVFHDGWFDV
jgi:hypothetical protein